MSQAPVKIKRRIAPIQILDDAGPSKSLEDNQFGQRFIDYIKYTDHKKYQKDIEKKAKKHGYEDIEIGPSTKPKSKSKKRISMAIPAIVHHGQAVEAIVKRSKDQLGNLNDYIVEYSKAIKHNKKETLHEYLKRYYDKKMFYSTVTKRFKKL